MEGCEVDGMARSFVVEGEGVDVVGIGVVPMPTMPGRVEEPGVKLSQLSGGAMLSGWRALAIAER